MNMLWTLLFILFSGSKWYKNKRQPSSVVSSLPVGFMWTVAWLCPFRGVLLRSQVM